MDTEVGKEATTEHNEVSCTRYQRAIELIGRKWTGVILRALLDGVTRFSDLTAAIPALSDKMLSERLKELEAEGLVERRVIPQIPVRVEYHLTEKGKALNEVIANIAAWGHEWLPEK